MTSRPRALHPDQATAREEYGLNGLSGGTPANVTRPWDDGADS